ncbi:MAG: hypothetical protein ACREVO_20980 [Steroidobacteraceae bacterium]
MERESLLSILVMLLGGLAMQPLASWRWRDPNGGSARDLEHRSWLRLWCPVVPLLLVAAWLCGWALVEPDPVPDPLDPWVVLAVSAPFALLFVRAGVRAAWAVLRQPTECGVSTVGLLRPMVLFSPFLAKQLDDGVIRAALAHERAHAAHRDPLRILLAQLITDLQWPWPSARRRLETWLGALELARDEEARAAGADGADLAAAVLASVRYLSRITPEERTSLSGTQLAHARLIGDSRALRDRVSRLLAPLPEVPAAPPRGTIRVERAALLLLPVLLTALTLGVIYGERVMHPLLGLTS